MGTIRVTGRGQLSLRPDTTRVTMDLDRAAPVYGEALQQASEAVEALGSALAGLGFARSELKTLSFGVDTEYESYQEDGVYKSRFAGYRARHSLKLEFPSDNDRLDKTLRALIDSGAKPELRLSFTVRDPEAAKNALLAKAVEDAREKALVLSGAAGPALREIESIDFSWGRVDLVVRPMADEPLMGALVDGPAAKRLAPDLEPEDIDVSDAVTVVWKIE